MNPLHPYSTFYLALGQRVACHCKSQDETIGLGDRGSAKSVSCGLDVVNVVVEAIRQKLVSITARS